MKKTFLLHLGMLSLSTSALATMDTLDIQLTAQASENQSTYYDTLAYWFTEGTEVGVDDIKTFWSGRCFENINPDQPFNSVLHVLEGPDVGPGLPKLWYAAPYFLPGHSSQRVDEYDYQEDPENFKTATDLYIHSRLASSIKVRDGVLSWDLSYILKGDADLRYRIRKHDKHLVMQINKVSDKSSYRYESEGFVVNDLPPGVMSYCYFFNKIYPSSTK